MVKNEQLTIILALVSIIFFILLFYWINYLVQNRYVIECFETDNTYNVNIPLTTRHQCTNFCGPNARCAITGHQCVADIDCPGCSPNIKKKHNKSTTNVPGNNQAGKLTWGVSPQYSTLTTDIGTQSAFYTKNPLKPSPIPTFGVNMWRSKYNQVNQMFAARYTPPNNLQFIPAYSKRYDISGQFKNDGPLPSNDYISF